MYLLPNTETNRKTVARNFPEVAYAAINASEYTFDAPYKLVCVGNSANSPVGTVLASPYTDPVELNMKSFTDSCEEASSKLRVTRRFCSRSLRGKSQPNLTSAFADRW